MDIRKARDEIWRGTSIYSLPLRATHYSRVSTEKYEQASSLENQESYFTDFIQKNPNWTFVPGYVDEGISGTSTLKRDSFNRMIADAKLGMFDLIITNAVIMKGQFHKGPKRPFITVPSHLKFSVFITCSRRKKHIVLAVLILTARFAVNISHAVKSTLYALIFQICPYHQECGYTSYFFRFHQAPDR